MCMTNVGFAVRRLYTRKAAMNETQRLLREYVEGGSESAYRELVRRYIDLVYSVACRQTSGDVHHAQDIVQTVFTDLARKARSLPGDVMLGGWLHRHCCFVASNLRRAEARRHSREQEAALMTSLDQQPDANQWQQLSPFLDSAIQELPAPDRDALTLRYFEQRDFRSIGAALGASEDAAQKRVSRAIEKLRQILSARAAVPSLAILEGLLLSNSVSAAPAGWAARVGSRALEAAPVKAGVAAAVLMASTGFKVAAVAALIIAGAVAWQGSHAKHFLKGYFTAASTSDAPETAASPRQSSAPSQPAIPAAAAPTEADAAVSNILRLHIVSAETSEPLPNVPVELRAFTVARKFQKRDLVSDSSGLCLVPPLEGPLESLQLTTRHEGYADTRLLWHPARGQNIPASYQLKLRRATPISGTVLDAAGNPVEGAQVGFNHQEEPIRSTLIESPLFQWVTAQTDSAGKWRINRVADEMIVSLRGGASHPEHVGTPHFEVNSSPGAEEQLRAGTHIFRLSAAVIVRGIVVESSGTPIANAKVLIGERGMSGSREGTTELDGTFEIKGCKPGSTPVTAEAPQYAPTTINIELQTNSPPVQLVLVPGKILKLRVVNQQGAPVPNANVWLNTMDHLNARDGRPVAPRTQASFSPKTDADGRVFWDQAPDHELTFDLAARGYMRKSDVKLRPDGSEHTIVLDPALVIRGTVQDAKTGAPIPEFRLATGWPETNYLTRTVSGHWSTIDRFWLSFADGKFEHAYEEPVLGGVAEPTFIFKIEAADYAPFVTRAVNATEGVVEFNVKLEKSQPLLIRVLQPDGSPAANSSVQFASAGGHVMLNANGFEAHSGLAHTTDSSGQLKWVPDGQATTACASHASGFSIVPVAQLQSNLEMRLQAWGRVELTYRKRGQPLAGQLISIQSAEHKPDQPAISFSQPVTTDAQGKLTLTRVPAGRYKLVRLIRSRSDSAYLNHQFATISVAPGQTAIFDYNEAGAEVRVRPMWPDGFTRLKDHRVFASIHTSPPEFLAALRGNQEALRQWAQSPEGRAFRENARNYPLNESEPGVWTSSPIPPGTYKLSITASKPSVPGTPPSPPVSGIVDLVVPEDPAETLDLGELPLRASEAAAVAH